MNKFRKPHGGNREGGRFGGRGDRPRFGARPQFQPKFQPRDNRGSGRLELYDAICAQCGKACQVPFQPNGRKEVYCLDCFRGGQGRPQAPAFRRPGPAPMDAPRPQTGTGEISELKRQVNALNAKIDQVLEMMTALAARKEEVPAKPKAKKKAVRE